MESTFRDLDQIDFSRHLTIITDLRLDPSTSLPSSQDRASQSGAKGILDELKTEFQTESLNDQLNTRRFALDLALSSIIVYSAEINKAGSLPKSKIRIGPEGLVTPDEDFTRATGRLSLGETPPVIGFAFLKPRAEALLEDSGAFELASVSPQNQQDDRIQSEAARSLMEEWRCGADPRMYGWKGWLESAHVDTGPRDNTRPLRSMLSPAQFKSTIPATRQDARTPAAAASVPIFPAAVPTFHSSPLTRRVSDPWVEDLIGPFTQVERGPHGSRLNAAIGKNKTNKKRIGGF